MSNPYSNEYSYQLSHYKTEYNQAERVAPVHSNESAGKKYCTCPQCGMKVKNQKGIPCVDTYCPFCGIPMSGK